MTRNRMESMIVLALILAIGVMYFATMREGHDWSGDSAHHYHHARNIVSGIAYDETGYIMNPQFPGLSPQSYPPGYPLLLAPLVHWFGFDLTPMKIEIIVLFMAFLVAFYFLVRENLSFRSTAAAIAIVGLWPSYWNFKDFTFTDIPFLPFLFVALFLMDRAYRRELADRPPPTYVVLVSFSLWFAYATRTVGLVLVPALLLHDLIRFRKLTRFALGVTAGTLLLVVLQEIVFSGTRTYMAQVEVFDLAAVRYRAVRYAFWLSTVWRNDHSRALARAFFLLTSVLAAVGCVARVRQKITVLETFVPLYIAPLLVFEGNTSRYIFPLIPLYVFYVLIGIEKKILIRTQRTRRVVFVVFVVLVLASFGARYTTFDYEAVGREMSDVEAEGLFTYVREETDPSDIFVARKPRLLAFHTDRSATVYHEPVDDADLWAYLRSVGVSYVVRAPNDLDFFRRFVDAHQDRLGLVYSNSQFALYKIDWTEPTEDASPRAGQ